MVTNQTLCFDLLLYALMKKILCDVTGFPEFLPHSSGSRVASNTWFSRGRTEEAPSSAAGV
jgi:hypothetical protein